MSSRGEDGSGSAGSRLAGDVLLVAVPFGPMEDWISRTQSRYPGLEVRWRCTIRPQQLQQDEKAGEAGAGTDPNKAHFSRFYPVDDVPEDAWDGVTLLVTGSVLQKNAAHRMRNVRYVQLMSAGADRWIQSELFKDPARTFCTTNGTHAPQIAEWAIASWLMFQKRFLHFSGLMQTGTWGNNLDVFSQDAPGLRMGILGFGAIGRQCARLGRTLGMEVYAYTRSEKATAESRRDDSYCLPGMGDPEGVLPARWFHGEGSAAVGEFLAQGLDLLIVSLPLTPSSVGILGREQFEILDRAAVAREEAGAGKRRTFLVNIARGKHVDTDALVAALHTGEIGGAALDVTEPEPLPADHPLWKAPNLLITPHTSWQSPRLWERIMDVVTVNLEKLNAGEPLINAVNRTHHY